MKPVIIAHDLGTSGDKASLHAADGRLLASHTVAYPTNFGPAGQAEQDPADWWSAFCTATSRLLSEAAATPAEVACVVLSGQMQSLVLIGADDEPLRPAIIWADTRAEVERDLLGRPCRRRSCLRDHGPPPRCHLHAAQGHVGPRT